ncbi:patched domain-containing protein 3-like [Glandiceps talaboti]
MEFDCLEKRVSRLLRRLGVVVGNRYVWFIIIPIIVSLLLALGGLRFTQDTDIESLFSPDNGPAKKHRQQIKEHFHFNYDGGFVPTRVTDIGRYAHVIVKAKENNGINVLEEKTLAEILKFDHDVKNITVSHTRNGHELKFRYLDICGKWKTSCVDSNILLQLLKYDAGYVNVLHISYPVTVVKGMEYFIGGSLGGVEYLNNTDIIKSAKAMSLLYSLRSDELDDVSGKWEDKFVDLALNFESNNIDISFIVSKTLDDDFVSIIEYMIPYLVIAFLLLTTFAVCTCMMSDWVTSKPILGILGVISALLAVVSAFGLLLLCGVPFIHLVIGMPFLTLGVGVDDMFIMIASWRTTSPRLSVAERLGETFSEAALSITITSLTDALAFGVGAISNFPSVRIFCCYCGVAIVFDYLYQITFFGGCMALIGHREKENRHCITMKRVFPRVEAPSKMYRIFCAGGLSKNRGDDKDNISEHIAAQFFAKYYGPFITHWWVKLLTVVIYVGYIGVAAWGCLHLSEGVSPKQLALDTSYSIEYYEAESKYLADYGPVVQFVITKPHDYSNVTVQNEVRNVVTNAGESEYFFNEGRYTTQCWLLDYLLFLNQTGLTYPDEETFLLILREQFLNSPLFEHYQLDLSFGPQNMTIQSSRFLMISRNVANGSVEVKRDFLHKSRNIAESSWIPMVAYHPTFVFDDHFDSILPSTIQNVLIATVGMLLVSFLLIPQPICGIYVVISIASIVTGVLGYMALWDVGLDFVSMITIVITIGFSVDYSAHITYAFVISPGESRNERAVQSLRLLGLPIVQSVISTLLSISLISAAQNYAFRAISKAVSLGIIFGGLHGLVFLPVFLTLIGPKKSVNTSQKKRSDLEQQGYDFELGEYLANSNHQPFELVRNPIYREYGEERMRGRGTFSEGDLWQPVTSYHRQRPKLQRTASLDRAGVERPRSLYTPNSVKGAYGIRQVELISISGLAASNDDIIICITTSL